MIWGCFESVNYFQVTSSWAALQHKKRLVVGFPGFPLAWDTRQEERRWAEGAIGADAEVHASKPNAGARICDHDPASGTRYQRACTTRMTVFWPEKKYLENYDVS